MVPHNLHVEPLTYNSAVVRWESPVGVPFCQLEYGPAGFTPGTGTLVDSITADSCLLTGLPDNTAFDILVRCWCVGHSVFSNYVQTAFASSEPCPSKIDFLDHDVSDSSFTVRWLLPDIADFGEAEWGPAGFSSGTLVSPIPPDSARICSLHVGGLPHGTLFEVRVRNWCDSNAAFSPVNSTLVQTLPHLLVSAVPNNPAWGYTTGSGSYLPGDTARLEAFPANEHCLFSAWNDGVFDNPRLVTVSQDTSFTALFSSDTAGIGINSPDGPAVVVLPNPAHDRLDIRADCTILRIAASDIAGRRLADLAADADSILLDVADWPRGLILLSVSTSRGTVHTKVLLR